MSSVEPSTCEQVIVLCVSKILPHLSLEITTTHYDKPPGAQPKSSSIKDKPQLRISNSSVAERQKRLLPYINFYIVQSNQPYQTNNQYQPSTPINLYSYSHSQPNKYSELLTTRTINAPNRNEHSAPFTPFLNTNALSGSFTPMVYAPQQKIKISVPEKEGAPNYSSIYEQLAQLKLQQGSDALNHYPKLNEGYLYRRKPAVNFIPIHEYENGDEPETHIHTYVPKEIEVPNSVEGINYETNLESNQGAIKEEVQSIPIKQYPRVQQQYFLNSHLQYVPQQQKPYNIQKHRQYLQEVMPKKLPVVLVAQQLPQKQYTLKERPKPIILLQPVTAPLQNYATEFPKYVTAVRPTIQTHSSDSQVIQVTTQSTPYSIEYQYNDVTTPRAYTQEQNSLNELLQKLQKSNTLPQTLTEDNIDNSIKTLVRILNNLKKQQKAHHPIVVTDHEPDSEEEDDEIDNSEEANIPNSTPEGGTPGKPGIDYPALANIPHTKFDCKSQRYKGFFADPDTNCQVWHYCDLNGGQASFLCPNGTIFSQVALTCDWWFNVKCSTTTQLYVLNERLYKYIIPHKPKFPEDYTGPLVDRYIALKFKEMEEKVNKEKAEEDKKEETLQHLEESKRETVSTLASP